MDPGQKWERPKEDLQEASAEAIGFSTRKHRDRFDESDAEIETSLLDLMIALLKLEKPDSGDTGSFYEALRAVYGPRHQTQAPLSSADGSTLLTDKDSIMSR